MKAVTVSIPSEKWEALYFNDKLYTTAIGKITDALYVKGEKWARTHFKDNSPVEYYFLHLTDEENDYLDDYFPDDLRSVIDAIETINPVDSYSQYEALQDCLVTKLPNPYEEEEDP